MADGNDDGSTKLPIFKEEPKRHISAKEAARVDKELDKILAQQGETPAKAPKTHLSEKERKETLDALNAIARETERALGQSNFTLYAAPQDGTSTIAKLEAARHDPTKPGSLLDLPDPVIKPFDGNVSRVADFSKATEYRTTSLTDPSLKGAGIAPVVQGPSTTPTQGPRRGG